MRNIRPTLLFSYITLTLLFYSCVTYDLSPKDEAWNPYEVGQKFTFVSNKGTERSFTISKVEKTKNRVNVYAGSLSKMKESLTVFAIEENGKNEETAILAIFKNANDDSFINFILNLSDMLEINHVEEIAVVEQNLGSIAGYQGDDLLSIHPTQSVDPGVQTPYVTNFIFSKSAGFLKFNLTNDEIWQLKNN